jgi:hypothetical protein
MGYRWSVFDKVISLMAWRPTNRRLIIGRCNILLFFWALTQALGVHQVSNSIDTGDKRLRRDVDHSPVSTAKHRPSGYLAPRPPPHALMVRNENIFNVATFLACYTLYTTMTHRVHLFTVTCHRSIWSYTTMTHRVHLFTVTCHRSIWSFKWPHLKI